MRVLANHSSLPTRWQGTTPSMSALHNCWFFPTPNTATSCPPVTMEVDNDHKPIVAAEPSLLPEGLELDANGVPKAINNLPSVGRRTTLKSLRAPKRLGSMSSKPKTAKTRTRAKRELPAL